MKMSQDELAERFMRFSAVCLQHQHDEARLESENAALKAENELLKRGGDPYFKKEIKTLNELLESAEEALRSVADQRTALKEQIEEVWKMTCEEKCGWNCCSHQIREFLSKKASE